MSDDLGLMNRRKKKKAKPSDQEESDEINACSIVVLIKVDGGRRVACEL